MQIKLDPSVRKILEKIRPKKFLSNNKKLVFKALENGIKLLDRIKFSCEAGYVLSLDVLVNNIYVVELTKDARLDCPYVRFVPHYFKIKMEIKHLATLSFDDGITFEDENERRKIVVIDEDKARKIEIQGYGEFKYRYTVARQYKYYETDNIEDIPKIYERMVYYTVSNDDSLHDFSYAYCFYITLVTPKHVFIHTKTDIFFVNGENETITKMDSVDLAFLVEHPVTKKVKSIKYYETQAYIEHDVFFGMLYKRTFYIIANLPSEKIYGIIFEKTFENNGNLKNIWDDINWEELKEMLLMDKNELMMKYFLNDLLS